MQVDDRVSLKTVNERPQSISYGSTVVRFGTSDAVSLIAVHYHIEGIKRLSDAFIGLGLSRNPGHEAAPPAAIAPYQLDEAIYLRGQWIANTYSGGTEVWVEDSKVGTLIVPAYGIIVPSRQILVWCLINGDFATGIVAEIYYRETNLSRQESDLLNITWGKYRR